MNANAKANFLAIVATAAAADGTDINIAATQPMQPMQAQDITTDVLIEKYAKGDETTATEIRTRIARALAAVEVEGKREAQEAAFLWCLENGFVPAGRINSAAGTDIKSTLINCFVQPVGDAVRGFEDGRPGIYTALEEAAETMRRGGGVGYDFSPIRPKDALVKGTHSRASGPISFMKVFNTSCETVESAGGRRGAQMGVLRCDHPDIEQFIHAKDAGDMKNFNLSIGVTDAFMQAVCEDKMFDLVHKVCPGMEGAEQRADGMWIYKTLPARDLWDQVMRSTYDHAEPGILFLDRMNTENNLWYCEVIAATNPCAEQPLPAYGCCCLGSINLTVLVKKPFTHAASLDFQTLKDLVRVSVRMLDNVLDATYWPLPQQKAEAMAKRRIGLGFLGLGDALNMLNLRYDTAEACAVAAQIAEVMRDESYRASIELAEEKGAFPLLDADKYLLSGFAKRLPLDIQDAIRANGIRNSHLTSIAPAGTISLAFADNASNGIEPAFSWTYDRKKRMADESVKVYPVEDHAWRLYRHLGGDMNNLPNSFVTALEMSSDAHVAMMKAVQQFIDTSISKTVNVDVDYPYADFKEMYMDAWKAGLKGLATYRPNSILGSVLSVTAAPAAIAAPDAPVLVDCDPLRFVFEKRPAGVLEAASTKIEYWDRESKKSIYVIVSFARAKGVIDGKQVEIERPIEFFCPTNQMGEGQQWVSSHFKQMSLSARYGVPVDKSLNNMRETEWEKGPVRSGEKFKEDGTSVPRYHDSDTAAIGYGIQKILIDRGYLDADGNQVPARVLSKKFAVAEVAEVAATAAPAAITKKAKHSGIGKKCDECGAHAVQDRDGCEFCTNCGNVGSCG